MSCCICRRPITCAEQDHLRVHDYPFLAPGTRLVHLLCLRILNCAGAGVPPADPHISDLKTSDLPVRGLAGESPAGGPPTCGWCGDEVLDDDDVCFFRLCGHKCVHLQCLALVDFWRKTGCPLCYTPEQDAVAVKRWQNATMLQSNMVMSYVSEAVIDPATGGGGSVTGGTAAPVSLDMMSNNTVKNFFDLGFAAATIKGAFDVKRPYMTEPSYPTPARQLMLETNFAALSGSREHRHVREVSDCPMKYVGHRYTFRDLVYLGLNLPIILYGPHELAVHHILSYLDLDGATVRSITSLPGPLFVNLLLAGVPLSQFVQCRLTFRQLLLMQFHAAAFVAAGGTKQDLKQMMAPVIATRGLDLGHMLPQFGCTEDMARLLI